LEANINDAKDQITVAGQSTTALLTNNYFSFLVACFGFNTGHYLVNCRKTDTEEPEKCFTLKGVLDWCVSTFDPNIQMQQDISNQDKRL
jgi:hypothetical protein